MTYWRMQLHPDESKLALQHTSKSLSAGYIGLGFNLDPGDLTIFKPLDSHRQNNEYTYWQFATEMAVGDIVAVFAHSFPVALVEIEGEYNYIRNTVTELGVWFNHFRKIKNTRYYLDEYRFDDWRNFFHPEPLPPTNMTIQRHTDPTIRIFQFIDEWHSHELTC